MNNLYILLELARWDRTGRLLQTLVCASKPLYAYLRQNKVVLAELRDSWLTIIVTEGATGYYDWCQRLHRLDGPAVIDRVCGKIWFSHGVPHRADGPAHSMTNAWIHQGRLLYCDYTNDTIVLQRRDITHWLYQQAFRGPYELAAAHMNQKMRVSAHVDQLVEEIFFHRRDTFVQKWRRWFLRGLQILVDTRSALNAYYSIRRAWMMQRGWYGSWLCRKAQAAVAVALGVDERPAAHTKHLRTRPQILPKLRARTPPYLGGVTGRMRQR